MKLKSHFLRGLSLVAYHGTPHKFEGEFLEQYIGSGEGAQAYGYGFYFAGNRGVAEYYRKTLARLPTIRIDGVPVHVEFSSAWLFSKDPRKMVLQRLAQNARVYFDLGKNAPASEIVEDTQRDIVASIEANLIAAEEGPEFSRVSSGRIANSLMNQLDALKALKAEGKITFEPSGCILEVDIPEDDELLDWDKLLSEQSRRVQEAVRKMGLIRVYEYRVQQSSYVYGSTQPFSEWQVVEYKDGRGTGARELAVSKEAAEKLAEKFAEKAKNFVRDMSGHQAYHELASQEGSEKKASKMLLDFGIPGLRYLDQGSRGSGRGTHNYVIWDANRIKITKRQCGAQQ
jgi:hypothetical protein